MYSDGNSFEEILDRCLNNEILDGLDKRVGSVIYNSLAPVCLELANAYIKMDILDNQFSLVTCTGSNLDRKAYEYGVSRKQATNAKLIATFKEYQVDEFGEYVRDGNGNRILVDMDVDLGARFVCPNDSGLTYILSDKIEGQNILTCEELGSVGNSYLGNILPLVPIQDLIEAKITDVYETGVDVESDADMRARVMVKLNSLPFGGNIDDYIEKTNSFDGVGNTKVFPAWQLNGSVLLSVVNDNFEPIIQLLIDELKEALDPTDNEGMGVGIAPIGHTVTVTTPIKQYVDISLHVDVENQVTVEDIASDIEAKIEEYFVSERKRFAQDTNLAIYRARIIDKVLEVPEVLNVTDVLLDDEDADVVMVDEGLLDHQYLPYVGEVTID